MDSVKPPFEVVVRIFESHSTPIEKEKLTLTRSWKPSDFGAKVFVAGTLMAKLKPIIVRFLRRRPGRRDRPVLTKHPRLLLGDSG